MIQFLGQIIDIRDQKLSDELRFVYYLVQLTMEVQFSGHQWLVLPPYLHPNVPTFFYPTQLGISAPLRPQAPVVAEPEVSATTSEGDFISSASDLVSCQSPLYHFFKTKSTISGPSLEKKNLSAFTA